MDGKRKKTKPKSPLDPKKDVLITVSGGCITGAFGPDDIRIVVIDFDNIREGDTVDVETSDRNDGPTDSQDAVRSIDEAQEIMMRNAEHQEASES